MKDAYSAMGPWLSRLQMLVGFRDMG
jgi:hypothetical protein